MLPVMANRPADMRRRTPHGYVGSRRDCNGGAGCRAAPGSSAFPSPPPPRSCNPQHTSWVSHRRHAVPFSNGQHLPGKFGHSATASQCAKESRQPNVAAHPPIRQGVHPNGCRRRKRGPVGHRLAYLSRCGCNRLPPDALWHCHGKQKQSPDTSSSQQHPLSCTAYAYVEHRRKLAQSARNGMGRTTRVSGRGLES